MWRGINWGIDRKAVHEVQGMQQIRIKTVIGAGKEGGAGGDTCWDRHTGIGEEVGRIWEQYEASREGGSQKRESLIGGLLFRVVS